MYLAKWKCEGDSTKRATAASWIRNQSVSLRMLTEKTQTMFNNYCASLESSPHAGRKITDQAMPQVGAAAVGFVCSVQLAGQPLKMDQTEVSMVGGGEPSSWLGALEVPEQSMTAV